MRFFVLFLLITTACGPSSKGDEPARIVVTGAMKDVMWQGKLEGVIDLGEIELDEVTFGVGPLEYLRGEILINEGKVYVSRVASDSSLEVENTTQVQAPFFVFGKGGGWNKMHLPEEVRSMEDLEDFLSGLDFGVENLGVFKLQGKVVSADIHVVNLPKGTKVSSPAEAHQGQVNYEIADKRVEIIGFYSTGHKGVFIHHDRTTHMHLITEDGQWMGHVDRLDLGAMELFWVAASE